MSPESTFDRAAGDPPFGLTYDEIYPSDLEPAAPDEDAIRAVVARLSRPHPSGGRVSERAAILAEGRNSSSIVAWVVAHAGEPEAAAAPAAARGLHADRAHVTDRAPLRYVLPAGALD
jgi:hypothetical protein